ncbi:sigma-70 family RNA polymerase sigma factor [uncultured Chitinophaga sp.]|uniref:RNA polymerase sigma factor n=2 Tax=Chitinophaga TaxID=79328 RepID=UPI00261403F6|nr:sigma-70 family RNA polymerase sigma factor [uncultured Chitinophaga sp.]
MTSGSLPYSDSSLLPRIAEGDEAAFADLFNQYSGPLSRISMRMLHSEAASQEVLQDFFIKLWLNRARLAEVAAPGPWLRKVLIRECLQYLRKSALYKNKLDALPTPADSQNRAIQALSVKEIQEAVGRALDAMPPQRKLIYRMSRERGMTTKEIAAELGLSDGYVRNALSAALQTIRGFLPPIDLLPVAVILYFF